MGVPQRSLPMDPSSLYGQGIIQPKPGLSGAGATFLLFLVNSSYVANLSEEALKCPSLEYWYFFRMSFTAAACRCIPLQLQMMNQVGYEHCHGPPSVALSYSFYPNIIRNYNKTVIYVVAVGDKSVIILKCSISIYKICIDGIALDASNRTFFYSCKLISFFFCKFILKS